MHKLQTKIDTIQCENASLKQELEFLRQKQEDAKNELVRAKEQAAIESANSGTAESKLRVAMIEIETLKLQKQDEERKVASLEERVRRLQQSRSKEDEYLGQLGKSCETLRKERNTIKDLQNEVSSLKKSMAILEATLSHVQQEKAKLEAESKTQQKITALSRQTKGQSALSYEDSDEGVSETKPRKLDFRNSGPSGISAGTCSPKITSKSPKQNYSDTSSRHQLI